MFQAALAAHFRRAAIRLVNAGVSGEAYSAMLNRLDRDVIAVHPDLVIWQLGTNAVIREVGVSQDEPAILKGVERLKAAGVDVILMNPQYAPLVVRDPDTPAMLKLLDDVGREERVPVFERFDAMREWIAEQQVPLSSFVSVDGLHMSDLAHRCVGVLLAQCVIDDVERGPATVEAAQDATR